VFDIHCHPPYPTHGETWLLRHQRDLGIRTTALLPMNSISEPASGQAAFRLRLPAQGHGRAAVLGKTDARCTAPAGAVRQSSEQDPVGERAAVATVIVSPATDTLAGPGVGFAAAVLAMLGPRAPRRPIRSSGFPALRMARGPGRSSRTKPGASQREGGLRRDTKRDEPSLGRF
jgi:hypothetical protein